MEYITHDELEQFSAYLTDLVVGSCRLNAKIEAFTSRYRKPTRIGRSRSAGRKGQVGHRGDIKLEEGDENNDIPSYLATGIILDGHDQAGNTGVMSCASEISSIFTQSLSSIPQYDPHHISPSAIASVTTLPIPRRQRSFSLTSCYTMRKPTRRRTSSLGDLSEPSSRVLLMDMISALNEAFPDYDFGDSKKEQFREQELPMALRLINGYFAELSLREPNLLEKLWAAIDEIVNLKNCEIFQYEPKDDDEADTYLWCFHYFFFNKELHTLCYFNCSADRYYII
jgi:hypothetical protein